ncbi:MAG: phosphatidate cytidylyltransferase [Candidatus Binatia bacterium]
MLRARLATAAVAIPILLYLVFLAPFALFRAVVLAFTLLALIEYFSMAFPQEKHLQGLGVLSGGLLALAIANASAESAHLFSGVLMGVVVVGLLASLFTPGDPERSIRRLGHTLLGVLYAGAFLPHLLWLRVQPSDTGAAWVLFILAVGMGGDTAGYFSGRLWGRRLLMPSVSPKKTIEGAAGAVGGNLLAGAIVKLLLLPAFGWIEILLLSLGAGALAQLGDLCESLLKRAFGAKDSGWLLPGHGGVLDRADSLVFPTVLVYYYVNFLRAAS